MAGLSASIGDTELAFAFHTAREDFLVVAVLVGLGVVVLVVVALKQGRARPGVLLLLSLVALSFVVAIADPVVLTRDRLPDRNLTVVLDVSESASRAAPIDLMKLIEPLHKQAMDTDRRWYGNLVAFGKSAEPVASQVPLLDLEAASSSDFGAIAKALGPDTSNIAAGLNQAKEFGGDVILVSDGLQNAGDAIDAAASMAAQGQRLHVIPLLSQPPRGGLESLDVPPLISNRRTTARGVLRNNEETPAVLGVSTSLPGSDEAQNQYGLRPESWRPFRKELAFTEDGLQPVRVVVEREDESQFNRDKFTFVTSPLKIAVVGEAAWLDESNFPEMDFRRFGPAEAFSPGNWDVVVLDGIAAEGLGPNRLAGLRKAVEIDQVGLLLINGPHPMPKTEDSVLISYADTPIDPLLPVSGDPRMVIPQRPELDVQVFLDVSGSMCGNANQRIARQLVNHVACELNPGDSLEIVSFDTTCKTELRTTYEQNDLCETVSRLPIICRGGGTVTSCTAKQFNRSNRCGMIFISDTEFRETVVAPECSSTVLAVGSQADPNRFADFDEFHAIVSSGGASTVSLEFMQPRPREEKFQRGEYEPVILAPGYLPLDTRLEGHAVSYLRRGGERIAVRPDPKDPLLAFRNIGASSVGVFTSAIPRGWAQSAAATEAIRRWLQRVASWSQRERYMVTAERNANALSVGVSVLTGEAPADIDLALVRPEGDVISLSPYLQDGEFRARITLPRESGWHHLRITEDVTGDDPSTADVPVFLPSAQQESASANTDERRSHGQNLQLLSALASMTGGIVNPTPGFLAGQDNRIEPDQLILWPWFAVLGGLGFLLLIFLERRH